MGFSENFMKLKDGIGYTRVSLAALAHWAECPPKLEEENHWSWKKEAVLKPQKPLKASFLADLDAL